MTVIKKFKFGGVDLTLPDGQLTINRKNGNTVIDTVTFTANQTSNSSLDLPTDTTVTEDSTNLVTSGAVYDAIGALDTWVSSVSVNGGAAQTGAVALTNIAITNWTNAFTGTNTFNTKLPTSTVTPANAADLTTKTYVDWAIKNTTVTLKSPDTTTTIGTFTTNQASASTITFPSAGASTYWMVKIDSVVTEDSNNAVTSDAVYDAIQALGSVYRVKGSKATYADLPSTWNKTWDVWNVIAAYSTYPAGTNFVWDGSAWDALWGTVDLSGYVTKAGNNAFTGTNTFNSSLPTSTVTPSNGTDLTTKTYVDWRIVVTSTETWTTDTNVLYIITQ